MAHKNKVIIVNIKQLLSNKKFAKIAKKLVTFNKKLQKLQKVAKICKYGKQVSDGCQRML